MATIHPKNPHGPVACIINDQRKTSTLVFANRQQGEYYMRGGICFPLTDVQGDHCKTMGYAVLCGLQVDTGLVRVFEHRPFDSTEHRMDESGHLLAEGIISWINRNWSIYGARSYYWHEDGVMTETYQHRIRRSKNAMPKPWFVEVLWPGSGSPEHVIWHRESDGSLAIPRSLREAVEAEQAEISRDSRKNVLNPPKHALICALVGLEQNPWRPRRQKRPGVTMLR